MRTLALLLTLALAGCQTSPIAEFDDLDRAELAVDTVSCLVYVAVMDDVCPP